MTPNTPQRWRPEGESVEILLGGRLALSVWQGESPAPLTGALVVAEDTYLVMDDQVPVLSRRKGARNLSEALAGARRLPVRPGSVEMAEGDRYGVPFLFRAVVYDFSRSPACREEDVYAALVEAFSLAGRLGISRLALRPLGTRFNGIQARSFLELLVRVGFTAAELGTSIERIDLLLPTSLELSHYRARLEEILPGRSVRGGPAA